MRDEDLDEAGAIINPDHDGGIRTAVNAWSMDPAAAKARYGPIASWDVSEVTDLSDLFDNQAGFNEDLSLLNVSNVARMGGMFDDATSFDRQLDGAWSISTADKYYMFYNSPGTIAGRTKAADGTVV